MNHPLQWGMSLSDMKEIWPNIVSHKYRSVCLRPGIELHNFPGDCGTLVLNGTNYVESEDLDIIQDFCSRNGFSKCIGTLVTIPTIAKERIKRFIDKGWVIASEGNSNRNPKKADYVVVLHIKDCIYRGY